MIQYSALCRHPLAVHETHKATTTLVGEVARTFGISSGKEGPYPGTDAKDNGISNNSQGLLSLDPYATRLLASKSGGRSSANPLLNLRDYNRLVLTAREAFVNSICPGVALDQEQTQLVLLHSRAFASSVTFKFYCSVAANMPSEKRSRDHAANSRDRPRSPASKRPRRDASPSRDWRSVYLDKNDDKKGDRDSYRSSRDHSRDREREKNTNGHYHHSSSRDDHYRSGGTSYRAEDRKDSPTRPRDKSRSRERGTNRQDSRWGSSSKQSQSSKPPVKVPIFPRVAADDEKEEGE